MMVITTHATPAALALLLGLSQVACTNRNEDAAPAPIDSGVQSGAVDSATPPAGDAAKPGSTDTLAVPTTVDTSGAHPDTSMATPPLTPPSQGQQDSTQAGAAAPAEPGDQAAQGKGGKFSAMEYEGWRQYSVNCARCHGQDVLPNPVAANLLISVGPGGPMESREKFVQVVSEGRPDRGMPAFKALSSPDQIDAIYAYVKGRAEKRLPPGRPGRPGT